MSAAGRMTRHRRSGGVVARRDSRPRAGVGVAPRHRDSRRDRGWAARRVRRVQSGWRSGWAGDRHPWDGGCGPLADDPPARRPISACCPCPTPPKLTDDMLALCPCAALLLHRANCADAVPSVSHSANLRIIRDFQRNTRRYPDGASARSTPPVSPILPAFRADQRHPTRSRLAGHRPSHPLAWEPAPTPRGATGSASRSVPLCPGSPGRFQRSPAGSA